MDVIVGNPPWLKYSNTVSTLRTELEQQSKNLYGIWVGSRYAAVQDIAGLFFARSTDLYLRDGGLIGMVMPHSSLQTGQYTKWRSGAWQARRQNRTLSVDFGFKTAWDLEGLEPNTFFPVVASVVFAQRTGRSDESKATPLSGEVERWLGEAGTENIQRNIIPIVDTSTVSVSPYSNYAREGATVRPTRLFFVEETENTAIIQASQTITLNPRRGSQDKRPWRDIDLTAITGQTIEMRHVFDVHLGETVVPYATLTPLKAVLPLKREEAQLSKDTEGAGGIRIGSLERRMRERWRTVSRLWEQNKAPANRLSLLGQLDYYGKLSSQLEWRRNRDTRPIRVAYTKSGEPTAALLPDDSAIVAYTLYWITCRDVQEANYLMAIINSNTLAIAVNRFTTANWAGNTRDLVKHLWKLPIPEFDAADPLHVAIADAGKTAAQGAANQLDHLRQNRPCVTVTIARRELRAWLRSSAEGRAVEDVVGKLLGSEEVNRSTC